MYAFLDSQFLGEAQNRLKNRNCITFTKRDVTVTYRYTHYPKNWDGSGGNFYSDKPALEQMVCWKDREPRYSNWH